MSIKVMSWVWENGPPAAVDRLVLLALADFCDDSGLCWPSMDRIGSKACMTGRGARNVIRRLEAEGWVETQVGGGRGGSSKYRIVMRKAEQDTGNDIPGKGYPETGGKKPGTPRHKTRNAGSAEPSGTFKDPSKGGGGHAHTREDDHDAILSAAGVDVTKDVTGKWYTLTAHHTVQRWRDLGLSQPEIIAVLQEVSRQRHGPPGSLSYFDQAMQRTAGSKQAAPLSPIIPFPTRRQTSGERLDDHLEALKARLAVQPFDG